MFISNRQKPANTDNRGFTLVEMLVIAPIALIIITGFVAAMIMMVGDVIANHTRNTMTFETQEAINTIEQDIRLSTEFRLSSGTMVSPQGKDGNTSPFSSGTSPNSDFILGTIATDKNPTDPERKFVYYNTPFSCTDTSQVYKNRVKFLQVIYYVKDDSLWRRTVIDPNDYSSLCAGTTPWQVNSCSIGYTNTTRCKTADAELVKNLTEFKVDYFEKPEDTIPLPAADFNKASTVKVSLTSTKDPAGRDITVSASTRITKLDSKNISLAVPAAPVISSTVSGRTATFTWPAIPNATSYIIRYNINGDVTASENTTNTSFSVPAWHNDTVTATVYARNTTGTSPAGTRAQQIPLWLNCDLKNSWVNYANVSEPYATCGYTMTKSGVVVLKGLLKNGTISTNVPLFQLPEGYRPAYRLIFTATMGGNQPTRINIEPNGDVTLLTSGTSAQAYLALDNIRFIPSASTAYSWMSLTLQNSWYHSSWVTDGSHPSFQALQDTSGRIHLQGLITPGTQTAGTVVATLPSGFAPSSQALITPTQVDMNFMYLNTSGDITPWGNPTASIYSIQSIFYPGTCTSCTNLSLTNGWTSWGNGFSAPGYAKATDGIVTLRGLGKVGTITNGTVIATLPVGYRPSARLAIYASAAGNFGRIDILPNGQIVAVYIPPSAAWVSFDNITFIAE